RVCLGERVLKPEGAVRGGPSLRQRLAGRSAGIELQQDIAISQSDITESIIWVVVNRLLELLDRLLQSVPGPLVPEIAPAQIELVGLRVRRIVPDQLSLLFTR